MKLITFMRHAWFGEMIAIGSVNRTSQARARLMPNLSK